MDRSSILALREARWEALFDSGPASDLEVQLVPSEMPDLSMSYLGLGLDQLAKEICARAFVDFRGYTNGESAAVPNTLDARLELYGNPVVRNRINQKLQTLNAEAFMGEDDAASD